MQPETAEFSDIQPDTLITATRPLTITPIAGRPATTGELTETARLSRYGTIVAFTTSEMSEAYGDLAFGIHADADAAGVAFANLADTLRRDGWTLTVAKLPAVATPF